ncbi:phage holin [Lysinibacillus sp. CNPSo 3705]|nr:phage holin [Lysinibacillus sp. CNPSo 3705]MDD1502109.1 phage holin [Lysinibacillus sp. CNPSo 3705]
MLGLLGIIIDPTTRGVSDSQLACIMTNQRTVKRNEYKRNYYMS